MGGLQRPNWFLTTVAAYSLVVSIIWTIFNVRMSLHEKPVVQVFGQENVINMTLILLMSLFAFCTQIFGLALVGILTGFGEYRGGAVMARAAAFGGSWVFGMFSFCIFDFLQVFEGLSWDKKSMRDELCNPTTGDKPWCTFLTAIAKLAVAMLVPQVMMQGYTLVAYARALARSRQASDAKNVALFLSLFVGMAGYTCWAVGSVGSYALRSLNMDFIRLLLTPFLAISVFLTLVFGFMLLHERSKEMCLLVLAVSGMGVFGFAGGMVYHWRRLRNRDYEIFGIVPCLKSTTFVHALNWGAPDGQCQWETLIVAGLTLCLAMHALVAFSCTFMLASRTTTWVPITLGAEGGDDSAGWSGSGVPHGASTRLLAPVESGEGSS